MVEMTLKLTGLGCSNYWADGWIQARTRTRTLNPRPHSYPNPNPNSNPHHDSLTLTLALALTPTLTPTPTLTRWNKLDGTIVILSAFDMGLTILLSGGGVNLSFLRILRMLPLSNFCSLCLFGLCGAKLAVQFVDGIAKVGHITVGFGCERKQLFNVPVGCCHVEAQLSALVIDPLGVGSVNLRLSFSPS